MKRKTALNLPDDPVVREVRAIRSRLWKKGGGTAKGFLELCDRLAAESATRAKPRKKAAAKSSSSKRRGRAA